MRIEQIYLTREDPYELDNLAGSASISEAQKRLTAELDRWMKRQNDPGELLDDVKEHAASKKVAHPY